MTDLFTQMQAVHHLAPGDIKSQFKELLMVYLNSFAQKKKETLRTMLEIEGWTEVQIAPYFQEVLGTINALDLSDDEFFNMAGGHGDADVGAKLTVNQMEYSTVNAVLELIKILYEYIKVIRFFKEISFEASSKLLELIDIFNSQVYKLILG